jgi:hypothetical protein
MIAMVVKATSLASEAPARPSSGERLHAQLIR